MRVTPSNITEVGDHEIFVFGSNESGIHGAGAAKVALSFGAEMYKGFGFAGNTFAIPTKDWVIKSLPLDVVEHYVKRFLAATKDEPEYTFLVTAIGTGLAGFKVEDIAPMFKDALEMKNVYLPQEFINYLT